MVRMQSVDAIMKIGLNDSVLLVFDIFCRTNVEYILVLDGVKYAGMIYRSLFIRKYSVLDYNSKDTVLSSGIYREHVVCFAMTDKIAETKMQAIKCLRDNKGLRVIPVLDKELKVIGLWEKDLQDDLRNEVDFFQKYVYCCANGYSISRFCAEKGYKRIIVIGGGQMASVLYNDLQQGNEVEILSILDHEYRVFGDIKSISWSEGKKAFKEADVSIVTYLGNKRVLEYVAKENGAKRVCSLNNIIDEIFERIVILERLKDLHKRLRELGVELYIVAYPRAICVNEKSEWERVLCESIVEASTLRQETEKYREFLLTAFHNEYEWDVINKAFIHAPLSQRSYHGYHIQNDMKTEYINILCGKRVTVNTCIGVEKKIHVFGKSWAFSKYSEDRYTLCSSLQRFASHKGYRVLNYGVCGLPIDQVISMMSDNVVGMHKGDKVVLMYNDDEKKELKLIDELLTEGVTVIDGEILVQRPHDHGELFVDRSHLNRYGEALLAESIYTVLFSSPKNSVGAMSHSSYNDRLIVSPITITKDEYRIEKEIEQYIKAVKIDSNSNCSVGCVVMNCNPFTYGHRYLIERAMEYVGLLYVFVVMEDKSAISFEHRFEMVKNGCKDLQKVVVVPSGKFMISDMTFPEYFEKECNQNVSIDATNDLKLFCENIAPSLGISMRFAGTEPHDMVTRQYNDYMRQILPLYNIDFIEIERKEICSDVISASKVRRLLQERKYSEMRALVPKTTWEYLTNNSEEILQHMSKMQSSKKII